MEILSGLADKIGDLQKHAVEARPEGTRAAIGKG